MVKLKVFIGYDEREHIAAEICKYSILKRSNLRSSDVKFLKSSEIEAFTRPPEPNQSTDFTYTRFMVPYLSGFKGYSVFCDCDFLFLDDIQEILRRVDPKAAVSVVKHPKYVPNSQKKMDGIAQHTMDRKNWASLIVFNNSNENTALLTPEYINTIMPGRRLHTFDWLPDSQIGSLSLDWNVLDGYYQLDNPRAIHYTDGGPWFENYKQTYYSNYWWDEYNEYTDSRGEQRTLSPDT
jgi:hypothetical protein